MEGGFYKVNKAVRWDGYCHQGSGGVVQSDVYSEEPFKEFIGLFDKRIVELTEERNKIPVERSISTRYVSSMSGMLPNMNMDKSYSLPLIFSNYTNSFESIVHAPYFISFFKEDEVKKLSGTEITKNIPALALRKFEDLKFFETFAPECSGIRLIRTDSDPHIGERESALEDIPIYLPYTSKKVVEKIITDQEKSYREVFERECKNEQAVRKCWNRPFGFEKII